MGRVGQLQPMNIQIHQRPCSRQFREKGPCVDRSVILALHVSVRNNEGTQRLDIRHDLKESSLIRFVNLLEEFVAHFDTVDAVAVR